MQAFVDATNNEISGVMSIAMILLTITLLGTLGSLSLTLLMTALGISTILITLGIAGWAGLVLNTATATIPLILFTLVLATSMHLFMSIVRTKTDDPRADSYRAVSVALGTQTTPIVLTSATTAVCMLSLMAVSSPPVQDIGTWTAIGVFVGTSLLLLVCPTILVKIRTIPRSRWQDFMQPILNRYARELERRDATSIATISLTVLAAFSIFFLEIDDDFVRYFDSKNEFRLDSEFVASKEFGSNNIEVVVLSGDASGIFDPRYIEVIQRLVEQIRSHPDILNAYSIVDALDPIKTHFGNEVELAQLSKEQIAQLFLGYELSLEYGHSASELVNLDRSSSRISILAGDLSAAEIRQLEDFLDSLARDANQFRILVTGESIPISHLSPRNISAMVISIASTFAVSALMLAVYFRQWRIAIVALIATVVPVVCGFGVWGTLNDTIGLATTVIVAVCMGVVIDDAIHMIFQYRRAQLRLNLDKREASAYAVHRVGSAIITTTVVLVIGFGVLLFSDFRLNSTFGGCSALILICALIFDLRILPEMLVWQASDNKPHNKNN
jgi:predicted RND superfamily exporter protein